MKHNINNDSSFVIQLFILFWISDKVKIDYN